MDEILCAPDHRVHATMLVQGLRDRLLGYGAGCGCREASVARMLNISVYD